MSNYVWLDLDNPVSMAWWRETR